MSLTDFLEVAPVGLILVEPDGVIGWANPEAVRLFGQELVGLSVEELVPPTSRHLHQDLRQGYQREPGLRSMGEGRDLTALKGDGSEFRAEIGLTPLSDGSTGVVVTDITRRLELQRELAQAKKLESLGRLCGGVAHDFNNILTSLLGFLDIAKEKPERLNFCLDQAEEVAQRARELVAQLVLFRPGLDRPDSATIDLATEVDQSVALLSPNLPGGINLKLSVEPAGRVAMSRSHLYQIVSNLWQNSVLAMPEGGDLEIKVDRTEGGSRLSVHDSGCGIEPEALENLYDPFYTSRPFGQGSGLGLSVVHGLVNQAGGSIQIRSQVGKGTEFELRFPRGGS